MSQPTFGPTYQVFAPYTGTDSITPAPAYILPPNNTSLASVVYGHPIKIPYTVANAGAFTYSNGDFQFAAGKATILGNNAWAGAATARSTLMGNFTDFLQHIESGLEIPGTVPVGAAYALGQAIADYMPAPLAESLYYRYSLSSGFAPGSVPCVDVRPGMVLRVEPEVSQLVGSGASLNGYVGAGRFLFRVSSMPNPTAGGGRLVAFDAFMASIKSPIVASSGAPLVAGGLLDLCQTANARSYVRLFYPASMPSPLQPASLSNTNNPAMVAAQTMGLMNQATNNYPTYAVQVTPPTLPNFGMLFLGRATIVPEIPVWLTDPSGVTAMEYVPVGTTLYHILERFIPSVPSVKRTPSFNLTRTYANVNSTTFAFNPFGTALASLLDVPLIAGDIVAFSQS